MRVERIELYHVAMPLVYPFRTAYGDDDCIESIIVRMCGAAAEGWGEAAPWRAPGYSPEFAHGAFLVLRDWLAPRLVGQDVPSASALQTALASVKGNYFAKAALDTAWWDLYAILADRPLWRLIGGVHRTVDVGADLGVMESVEDLLAEVARVRKAGFKRLKLKFRPGWDLPVLRAVREAHPDLPTHIDCNSAYTLEALPMFREVDALGLTMIEQPLAHDDLIDHAALQRELRTPLCLDESITSPARARKAIALGACGWVNVKPGRVGGLTHALAIHNVCEAAGVPCWVGGMLESALGQGFSLALATLPNFRYPADIFPSARFYRQDLADPEIIIDSDTPTITAPEAPGVGFRPDMDRLRQQTLRSAAIDA